VAEDRGVPRVRLICTGCGKRSWGESAEGTCRVCGAALRPMRRFEALVDRWFGPSEAFESEFYHRHRQLMELLWSADGRGQEYYNILRPGVPYSRFTRRVTDIVCQGILEGWIEMRLPAVPTTDDAAYGLIFKDPDRFAAAVTEAFAPSTAREQHS
jgi:hypothetical protein